MFFILQDSDVERRGDERMPVDGEINNFPPADVERRGRESERAVAGVRA